MEVAANDDNSHSVQLYTAITGEWLIPADTQPESDQLFEWATTPGDIISHEFSLQNQTKFLEVDGRPRYGSVVYSTKQVCCIRVRSSAQILISVFQTNGMTYEVDQGSIITPGFIASGVLNNTVDSQFRAIDANWTYFAFAHDLGVVGPTSSTTTPVVYTIGYVRDPLVQLLNIPNVNSLRGTYYLTRYNSTSDVVRLLYAPCANGTYATSPPKVTALLDDYPNALARANDFDDSLTSAAFCVTPQDSNYTNILALSARQMFGNIEITAGLDDTTYDPTDIMAFMSGMRFLFEEIPITS